MGYEKMYKEALERARKGMPIDEVFPELRESEDERIRKWILNYIHHGAFNEEEHPMALKAIEWFEKQKEQKPEIKYVYPIFKVGDTIKPKAYNESHRINEIKDDNYVLDKGFAFPIVDQDVWEIVEQKPAGWSEEDWKLLDEMRDYLMSMCYSIDLSPNHIYEGFIDLIDRLKSLRPQPKQEWTDDVKR